jgi:DNA-binding XRE family transcriptional regulator
MKYSIVFFELSLRYAVLRVRARFVLMSTLRFRFGRRVRQVRRQQDLTQEQLAEAAGISVEFLSNIERGVNAPSFETLEKLAEVLQVPVQELFHFPE